MPPEGMQLDRRGLKLLYDLVELGRQITHAEALGRSGEKRRTLLIARRILTRRTAKSHCAQAGLSWPKFQEVLRNTEKAEE